MRIQSLRNVTNFLLTDATVFSGKSQTETPSDSEVNMESPSFKIFP